MISRVCHTRVKEGLQKIMLRRIMRLSLETKWGSVVSASHAMRRGKSPIYFKGPELLVAARKH